MRRSNKHQAQKVNMYPLNGGINVSQVPEQIAVNEMQECQNFIYERDSARLVGRGGLEKIMTMESEITGLHYDLDTNTVFSFLSNRDCWQLIISSGQPQMKYLDKIAGSRKPKCERFKDKIFIASGDHLQFYDFSPTEKLKMVRRLVVSQHGRPALRRIRRRPRSGRRDRPRTGHPPRHDALPAGHERQFRADHRRRHDPHAHLRTRRGERDPRLRHGSHGRGHRDGLRAAAPHDRFPHHRTRRSACGTVFA